MHYQHCELISCSPSSITESWPFKITFLRKKRFNRDHLATVSVLYQWIEKQDCSKLFLNRDICTLQFIAYVAGLATIFGFGFTSTSFTLRTKMESGSWLQNKIYMPVKNNYHEFMHLHFLLLHFDQKNWQPHSEVYTRPVLMGLRSNIR